MGIKITADDNEIQNTLNKFMKVIDEEITRTLNRLGEEAVIIARDRPQDESWIDHTGNLRSSIGYKVMVGDEDVSSGGFKTTQAPQGNGAEGVAEGKSFLGQCGSSGKSNTLVIVAGMNYADRVEAIEGKDVLATAELKTREKLPIYIEKTKERITKLIEKQ